MGIIMLSPSMAGRERRVVVRLPGETGDGLVSGAAQQQSPTGRRRSQTKRGRGHLRNTDASLDELTVNHQYKWAVPDCKEIMES